MKTVNQWLSVAILAVIALTLAIPLWAISEGDALKKARAIGGPTVEMTKKGYDGKNWRVMVFYIPCADGSVIDLAQGSTWDIALSGLTKKLQQPLPVCPNVLFAQAQVLAGPLVKMYPGEYDGTGYKNFRFVIPAPLCIDREIVLGDGSTLDLAFAALQQRVKQPIDTAGGALRDVFQTTVSGGYVASMRMAIDGSFNGAEAFRSPDLNALDPWVYEHSYSPVALQNGLHAWCAVIYGPQLGPSGQAQPANLLRIAN
jgi:hypothetical protein